MENESATVTNKGGKKKIYPLRSISVGGEGGIAGLLVFGGALAVAGFMAVASFASNKNKEKGKSTHDYQPKPKRQLLLDDECKSEDNHETTHSLSFLIQQSTAQDKDNACCWTSNMGINQCSSSELLSAQTLIMEEKIDQPNSEEEGTTGFHPQEIVFSDYSHPESAASSNENGGVEDCLVSLLKSSSGQVDKDEPQDGLKSVETETETEDDDMEEDGDVDVESDGVLGSGEEDTSNATGSTSQLDYNDEPVWPAELIQEPEQEFNGDYCDSHLTSDCDADGSDYAGNDEAMTVTKEATLNEKANFSVALYNQPSPMRTRVIPMLLLALLLLLVLLTRRPQESFYVLDDNAAIVL